jgi:5-formyltetrahydrofolate cyclo-ligase
LAAHRADIPLSYRKKFGAAALTQFLQYPYFQQSQHIACYLPFKNECRSLPIMKAIWQANKICYLPIISSYEKNVLMFVRYQYGEKLHKNRYSILEPVDCSSVMTPNQLDIVIMPLLAFDLAGHRLGTGGGYYDRTFAFIKTEKNVIKRPMFVGLAYSTQQIAMIPYDPWDITLDIVVTENKMIYTR